MPLRYELPDLDIYAAVDGQAVVGADLPECPGSQLPGVCGFTTLMDAGRTCIRLDECNGVNVFWNGEAAAAGQRGGRGGSEKCAGGGKTEMMWSGPKCRVLATCCLVQAAEAPFTPCPTPAARLGAGTNGCGAPAFVLTSEAPTGNNTLVSPLVSSYAKRGSPQDVVLRASEGSVIPPTAAELEAAAASSEPDSAWLGCIIAPHTIMAGTLVQVRARRKGWGCRIGWMAGKGGAGRAAVRGGKRGERRATLARTPWVAGALANNLGRPWTLLRCACNAPCQPPCLVYLPLTLWTSPSPPVRPSPSQVIENVPSSQACCRACRAKGAATANVWNYCAETGGCIYTLSDGRAVNMRAGQCELRYNLATNLAMGKRCCI